MQEITIIENKDEYLKSNYPFTPVPNLSQKVKCIHCDAVFFIGEYKVFKDENGIEYICCANAPECDGTVIDWVNA